MKSNGIFISHIFNKKHSEFKKNSFKETMLLKKKITASFFDKKEILKLLENFQIVSIKESLKKDLKSKYVESFWLIVAKNKMKTAVIIGSGIAGIVAGKILAQKGYKVKIIESSNKKGGPHKFKNV